MDLFEFEKLVNNGNLYLDGATGTNLQRQGLKSGACPETWIMEHPDIMQSLQLEYLRSGSNIIYAPTFTANRIKLAEFGIRDSLSKLNHDLVSLSREAVRKYREESESSRPCFVAGDVTMTGLQLYPVGSLDFEELVDIYREQIGELMDAGCDLLAIETMMSLNESRAALIAAREIGDFPVFVTMTFEENGRSLYGTDPLTALLTLQSLGATAFGINCSTGPSAMLPWIEELTAAAEIPIICKPNAGLPKLDPVSGRTFYDLSPEDFALSMRQAVEAGARIVGGCCGTTPRHIQKLVEKTSDIKNEFKDRPEGEGHYLTSERKTFFFGLNDGTRIIGERLNPTGKKTLQAELRERKTDLAVEMAETQEEKGAFAIDVNVGVSGIDEKAMMQRVIDDVSAAVSIPLVIDTSRVDVMEAALRRYPGRPLINSISAESERMEPMLRLAKKYGAMFIILPVSDEGFPKTLEDRKRNAKIVIEKALSMGLKKADMVVDGLVGTVAAERNAALDTAEFIRYCKNELGLATIVGLSNISFGLPARQKVNSAFLAMASMSGLTMALLNPEQDLLVDSLYASNLLSGREGAAESYIEREARDMPKPLEKDASNQKIDTEKEGDALYEAVLRGRRKETASLAEKELSEGRSAQDILDGSLIPAINETGRLFEKKRYFLPQLIASGEAMERAVSVLEPHLQKGGDGREEMPAVVIATVQGDIHDIGKNLVALMLRNYGYKVYDLGKDVAKEKIVEAAIERKAQIIALSALMTTTMGEMEKVIEYAGQRGVGAQFMVGGAAVTREYAESIKAHYSSDAQEAVKLAARLTHAQH